MGIRYNNNNHNNILKPTNINTNNEPSTLIGTAKTIKNKNNASNNEKNKVLTSIPINKNNPFSMVLNKTKNGAKSNITSITSITNTNTPNIQSPSTSISTASSTTSTPTTIGGWRLDQLVDVIMNATPNNNNNNNNPNNSILNGLNIGNTNTNKVGNPFSDSMNNNLNKREPEKELIPNIKIINNNNPFSCQSPTLSSHSTNEHNKDDLLTVSSHSNDTNTSLNVIDEEAQHHDTKKNGYDFFILVFMCFASDTFVFIALTKQITD